MALDDKNIRKKKNLQSDRGSEKNRIKNITSKVHPEYAASSNRKRSSRELSEEEKEKRAQIAEVRRRRQHQERRRKIIQRRKRQRALRIIASCLIVVALVVTVFMVKNYNSGSRHDNKGLNAYENGDYETAVNEFKEAIMRIILSIWVWRISNRNLMMKLWVILIRPRVQQRVMIKRSI